MRSRRSSGALVAGFVAAFLAASAGGLARAETLTWAQVKDRAAKQSPAAIRGRQAVRAAHADAAGAGRWPRANPVLTGTLETGAPLGQPDDFGFGVAIDQELDVVGLAVTASRAARKKVAVAEGEAAVARLDGLAEAADAFFDLDRAQRAIDVWIDLDKTYRAIAAGTARAAGAGEKSQLEAILAEADSAGAGAELGQARIELARAQTQLALIVAAPDPLALRVVTDDAAPPPDARALTDLVAVATRRRPEPSLWQARYDEAEARRSSAARLALPQPTIGFGVRHERYEQGREAFLGNPGELTGIRQRSSVLEFRLSIPLTFFDRNQANRARALADASSAREGTEISAREIRGAVTRAKAAVDASWTALSRWRALEPKLTEAQALLEKGYAAGQVGLLDTLSGAERVARARVRSIDSRTTYLKARAELARALGEAP